MQLEINNMTDYELAEGQSELICKTADMALKLGLEHYDGVNIDCCSAEACLSIVDNAEIRKLNEKFRGINKVTDVLSFPLQDITSLDDLQKVTELGDIVISIEQAREQAEEYGHSIERELCFLTAHSILHLLGYDHEEAHDEDEMCRLQEESLRRLGLFR